MEMILLGEPISAQEAKEVGLVNGVFEGEELTKKVMEKAELIAEKSGTICQMAKRAVKVGKFDKFPHFFSFPSLGLSMAKS